MLLEAQSKAIKQENVLAERLHGLDQQMERKGDETLLRWMIYLVVLADTAECVRDAIGFEYCLASSSGWTKSSVLWEEIGESSLTGLERKPLEFEVGDRVMLKVSPWKGVVSFGKKSKLPRSLHVPLDEIKVDKTLHFVEEPVEIMDREIKSLKRSKISPVKVRWNSSVSEFLGIADEYMKLKFLSYCLIVR
ncbi:hypothetical protein Tco_0871523 [Tanacetum coccineum]